MARGNGGNGGGEGSNDGSGGGAAATATRPEGAGAGLARVLGDLAADNARQRKTEDGGGRSEAEDGEVKTKSGNRREIMNRKAARVKDEIIASAKPSKKESRRRAKEDADGDEPTEEDMDLMFGDAETDDDLDTSGEDDEDIDEEEIDDDEDESDEDEADDEESDDDESDEDDEEEDAATARRNPKKPAAQPKDDSLHTITVNGEDVQVTYQELRNGYSRQQDYTAKTSEVAQHKAQYGTLIDQLVTYLQGTLEKEPDWDALEKEDPIGYAPALKRWNDRKDQLATATAEQNRLAAEAEGERKESFMKFMAGERAKLPKLIPQWADKKIAKQEIAGIKKYLTEVGFSAEEIGQLADARAIMLIRKAVIYDRIKRSGKGKIKPVRMQRTAVAPGSSRTSTNVTRGSRNVDKAREALRRTGSDRAAESYFEGILG